MRYITIALSLLLLSGCNGNQERWYLEHPEALNTAIKNCPEQHPRGISCEKINLLKRFRGGLGMSLQRNPQAFGQRIIQMQSQKAELEQKRRETKDKTKIKTLNAKIKQINQDLDAHILTVRLLESPEG